MGNYSAYCLLTEGRNYPHYVVERGEGGVLEDAEHETLDKPSRVCQPW
jgi:hypothetical protein